MLLRTATTAAVVLVLLFGAMLLPARATTPRVAADAFAVDVAHSTVIFKLRHFGISNFYGRVKAPSGSFLVDDSDLAGSMINVTLEIKNMDSGNVGRDRFLLSPDFFNEREYPTAEFNSSSIKKLGEGTYEATGTFTMHGVSNPVTVRIDDYTTAHVERFGHRGGFECTFTVKRSDYGMDLFVKEGTLGDEVTIIAAIEGVVRPE